jgi:hypothetical protein
VLNPLLLSDVRFRLLLPLDGFVNSGKTDRGAHKRVRDPNRMVSCVLEQRPDSFLHFIDRALGSPQGGENPRLRMKEELPS